MKKRILKRLTELKVSVEALENDKNLFLREIKSKIDSIESLVKQWPSESEKNVLLVNELAQDKTIIALPYHKPERKIVRKSPLEVIEIFANSIPNSTKFHYLPKKDLIEVYYDEVHCDKFKASVIFERHKSLMAANNVKLIIS